MTLSEKKFIDCIFLLSSDNIVLIVAELSEDFVFIPCFSVVRCRIVVA